MKRTCVAGNTRADTFVTGLFGFTLKRCGPTKLKMNKYLKPVLMGNETQVTNSWVYSIVHKDGSIGPVNSALTLLAGATYVHIGVVSSAAGNARDPGADIGMFRETPLNINAIEFDAVTGDFDNMSPATLHGAVAAAAARIPGSPVHFPNSGEYLTLLELSRAATAAGRGLVAAGVTPGDRVGILSRNNADFLISLLGANAAGAAAAPLPLPASVRDLGGYAARLAALFGAAGIRRVVTGAGAPRRQSEGWPARCRTPGFLPAATC